MRGDFVGEGFDGSVEAFGGEDSSEAKDDITPLRGGDVEEAAGYNDEAHHGEMDLGVGLVAEEVGYATAGVFESVDSFSYIRHNGERR